MSIMRRCLRCRPPKGRASALLAVALSVLCLSAPAIEAQSDAVVVYLVRHAERAEDGTNDPPISEAGRERAEQVAAMLRDAGITHVHSTDFRRTRATGAPTAAAAGVEISVYDPRDLRAFADRLRETPGRHLVLGHSNTTPQLVDALGGESGGPIEEMEYDRAYVVVVLPGGDVGSAMFRYGRRFEAGGG